MAEKEEYNLPMTPAVLQFSTYPSHAGSLLLVLASLSAVWSVSPSQHWAFCNCFSVPTCFKWTAVESVNLQSR